ncbi:MAG: class I SAM-dependent methyltransferase [Steroidobacteraceae bacterium]
MRTASAFDYLRALRLYLRYTGRRFPKYRLYQSVVRGRHGIEIGGPSKLFRSRLPLYPVINHLDGVNFSHRTIWEGDCKSGRHFRYYGERMGQQFIADATDLSPLASESYDFVLSSNCLEHVANPLKALAEWRRVLRQGGALVLVLPNQVTNFDHRRPVTAFSHLLDDLHRDVDEADLTHLDEILALHDLSLDPPAGTLENFKARSLENFKNRALHHHVFDLPLIDQVLLHAGFEVLNCGAAHKDLFALATRR